MVQYHFLTSIMQLLSQDRTSDGIVVHCGIITSAIAELACH